MKCFVIDCSNITTAAQFWETYLAVVKPEGAGLFGRNLDAFNDALAGGPGYPGECELSLFNSSRLHHLDNGQFLRHLREIATEPHNEAIVLVFR
ncbi:barstar family protein [Xanthomonas campestris]|uniref:barstar family protein n=1 Tax=Xanthomonas campestris TaxID=339 RepID=UPI0031BFD9AB|nr:barstar family protein [Xanthomonas campestris]